MATSKSVRSAIRVYVVFVFCLQLSTQAQSSLNDDYWAAREEIIKTEAGLELGANIQLNSDELVANGMLMKYKEAELDASFEDPGKYLPSRHFFDTKTEIESNEIFRILRELPKGALLHTHDTATTSWEFVYQQTWKNNLYLCNDPDQPARLRFFQMPDDTCDWKLVQDLRDNDVMFEEEFKGMLTLVRDNHIEEFSDINKVWSTFQTIFILVNDMLLYRPVFEDQYYNTLEELYNDNITYLEFRGTLSQVYELDGTVYKPEELIEMYVNITEKFKAEHPGFIGAKIIYAPMRLVEDETVENYIEIAQKIKAKFPDFVAGFDLVGQEDLGRPLIDYVDILKSTNLDYYFHAGETNWNQGLSDMNLIDAILLGTKRLGHAYALIKHPELMNIVKRKQIALEVSPISNQVLCLVKDLRNHPGSVYMANNMPMVITNDDPTYWGAQGVSYDWYMAFMGMSSRTAGLKLLKQLAINSLEFSSLVGDEKNQALAQWEEQWNSFISRWIKQE